MNDQRPVASRSTVRNPRVSPASGTRTVISNADPKATLGLLDASAPDDFRARVGGWRITSPVLKVNCALDRLPDWHAVPGEVWPSQAPVTIGKPMDDAQRAF